MCQPKEESTMNHTTVAVDVAKSVFQLAVSERPGHVGKHHRLTRAQLTRFFSNRATCTILMEACGSAHHWGRQLEQLGHSVRLLPAHAVRPYVCRNKTDRADAVALLEAARKQDLRDVPLKSVAQQTLTALHRLRSCWSTTRTARLNTMRGLLREFGVVIPVGARQVVPHVRHLLEDDDSGLPDVLRPAMDAACREILHLEQLIADVEAQLKRLAPQIPGVSRLLTIPGIGLLTATALAAFVGDLRRFPTGRHFASYLGLTPREHSSGLTRRLGSISKRGDVYLRMLLIHGARSVLVAACRMEAPDRLRAWALKLQASRGHNKATVALANRLARIAWAVWCHQVDFAVGAAPGAGGTHVTEGLAG
jgi:transposase